MSVCLSIRMEKLASHWADLHEIWYLRIFRISVENVQVSSKSNKNIGYFRWRPTHIISHWILFVMKNVSDKICDENLSTTYMLNNFFPKINALWNNVAEYGRVRDVTDRNILPLTRFAWWIDKAINTHSDYVIFTPFPPQQWLRERASILRYTYIDCLVKIKVKVIPQEAEVARGLPGRLRSRIFLTFGTTRVVGGQSYLPAPLLQEKSLVLIFRGWVDPRVHGSVGEPRKKSPVTPPGIDPWTVRVVARCLNHYATPDPPECLVLFLNLVSSYYCMHYIYS